MKKLVLYTFIIFWSVHISAQTKKSTIDCLLGEWILTNNKSTWKHDTITFNTNNTFFTQIVVNTTNKGSWKIKKNGIRLKSCLHSADNVCKCRKWEWIWAIIEIKPDSMIVIQNEKDTLVYTKTFTLSNVVEKSLNEIIEDTLFARWSFHPYSSDLTIYSNLEFSYRSLFHSTVLKVKEFSGSAVIKPSNRIKLMINNKTYKVFKKKAGFLVERRRLKIRGRRLAIEGVMQKYKP